MESKTAYITLSHSYFGTQFIFIFAGKLKKESDV